MLLRVTFCVKDAIYTCVCYDTCWNIKLIFYKKIIFPEGYESGDLFEIYGIWLKGICSFSFALNMPNLY